MARLSLRCYRRLYHWLSRARIAGHSRGKIRVALYDRRQVRFRSLRRRIHRFCECSYVRRLVYGQHHGGCRGFLCHDEYQTPTSCLHPYPRYRVF